jgi:hypothetical protein
MSNQPETVVHDRYLAEANAELDAMLGEVGELDSAPPAPEATRSLMRLLLIAAVAVVVFAVGVLLLRGRRPRMTMHVVR